MTKHTKYQIEFLWLALGMISLFIATCFAILLVAAKSPLLGTLLPDTESFQRALVLHVNLNIVLWIGSIASYLWSRTLPAGMIIISVSLSFIGLILLLTVYFSAAQPLLNNYVPVFDDQRYFTGILLILSSFVITAIQWLLMNKPKRPAHIGPNENWSLSLLALLLLSVIAVLALSFFKLDYQPNSAKFFEQLLWGPGHLWQLFSLQLMITVWAKFGLITKHTFSEKLIWSIPVIASLTAILAAVLYAPDSSDYRMFYTQHMRIFSFWILPVILATAFWRTVHLESRAMQLSAVLFLFGAFIGLLIRADNLMVPAHYHAVTGAINLSMMALVLGIVTRTKENKRLVRLQMHFYATSVAMLAAGLAWSGSLGGVRKVTLSAQTIDDWQHISVLGLMGVGGILAATAIFLFMGISLLQLRKVKFKKSALTPMVRSQN